MKKRRIRSILNLRNLIILLVIAAVLYAGSYLYDSIRRDPNFAMQHTTTEIKLNKTRTVKYESSRKHLFSRTYIPYMYFVPDKSTSYTLTLSDMKSEGDVHLTVTVTDNDFTDYIRIDSMRDGRDGQDGDGSTMSGSSFLNKNKKYYVLIDAEADNDQQNFSGSFNITISRTPEESPAEIAEIKEGETVKVTIDPAVVTSILFRPEETGYYRFDSTIKGKRAVTGSSGISEIVSGDGKGMKTFGGISYLDAGSDYYVAVTADENESRRVKAEVTCSRVERIEAEDDLTFDIVGETVIEYPPATSNIIAVWSESEGDPQAVVFDRNGVPVSNDNNSGEPFSGNRKDFALVFQADNYKKYRIFVGGDFDECKVMIAPYIGDGSTLGPDSVSVRDERNTGKTDKPEPDITLD